MFRLRKITIAQRRAIVTGRAALLLVLVTVALAMSVFQALWFHATFFLLFGGFIAYTAIQFRAKCARELMTRSNDDDASIAQA